MESQRKTLANPLLIFPLRPKEAAIERRERSHLLSLKGNIMATWIELADYNLLASSRDKASSNSEKNLKIHF